MLTCKAWDPVSGSEIDVFISHDRLQAIGKRSRGQILEAAELIPQALQCRGAVFEGLCLEEDEDRRGVGWRCYCCFPDRSYTPDGDRRPPRRGGIFLVFVNEDRVAYNWRWEKVDDEDPNLPCNYKKRFKENLT
jgi:hypothetical protein